MNMLEMNDNLNLNVIELKRIALALDKLGNNPTTDNIHKVLNYQKSLLDTIALFVKDNYFPPEICIVIKNLDTQFEALRQTVVRENPSINLEV